MCKIKTIVRLKSVHLFSYFPAMLRTVMHFVFLNRRGLFFYLKFFANIELARVVRLIPLHFLSRFFVSYVDYKIAEGRLAPRQGVWRV